MPLVHLCSGGYVGPRDILSMIHLFYPDFDVANCEILRHCNKLLRCAPSDRVFPTTSPSTLIRLTRLIHLIHLLHLIHHTILCNPVPTLWFMLPNENSANLDILAPGTMPITPNGVQQLGYPIRARW